MKIVAAGVTGFIGTTLLRRLEEQKHDVILLTRSPDKQKEIGSFTRVVGWDGNTAGEWQKHVDGASVVINLTGEPIAGRRWSVDQKKRILDSRVNSTRAIVEAIRRASKKPDVLVNASAVGFYGAVEEGDVTESKGAGEGFLAATCERWEEEARTAESLGVRVVLLRTGVVIGDGGGALAKMVPPFKFFVGGPIGSGAQWFPWIHRDDVIGAILFAITNSNLHGPVNLAAPESVTMRQFCSALGSVLHRPSWAPVPAFALKLLLGEMSGMLLTGQKVIPQQLLKHGYRFVFPKLRPALQDIFRD